MNTVCFNNITLQISPSNVRFLFPSPKLVTIIILVQIIPDLQKKNSIYLYMYRVCTNNIHYYGLVWGHKWYHVLCIILQYTFLTLHNVLRCLSFEQATLQPIPYKYFLTQTILQHVLWSMSPWAHIQAFLKSGY